MQVLYNLEVAYALLMPALNLQSEEVNYFQINFLRSGGVACALNMLTKNNFLPSGDLPTRRAAFLTALKLCKLCLTTVGHAEVSTARMLYFSVFPCPKRIIVN